VSRLVGCVLVAVALVSVIGSAGPTAAVAATPPPPTVATGGLGLRLVDVPVSERDDPRAQEYIIDHLAPGAVIHRRIEVSNTTGAGLKVAVYAAAATIAKGSFLGSAGHTPNDLTSWSAVSPSTTEVAARGTQMAIVTISVPSDAAPGERYGVVWAEVRSAPVGGGGVVQVSRVGIRLYLSVGPGGPPAANFTIASLTAERAPDGQPMVVADVRNTGGRALDMSGSLDLLAGPGGLRAGPFPATLGVTLAIGDSEPVSITLDRQLPAGPWDARVTLRSGLLQRSARASLTFPAAGAALPVRAASVGSGALYPALVVVALLLVAMAVLVEAIRRRRSRRGPVSTPVS